MKLSLKNWRLIVGCILTFLGLFLSMAFVLGASGCSSSFEALRDGGTVVIKKKKKVRMWTDHDCYYCDKAKEFFKKNKIEYTERSFNCGVCRNELFSLANKLKFDTSKIDGVPVIVIDENKIIVGYSPGELTCLLLSRGCSKRVYNRYLDAIKIKK